MKLRPIILNRSLSQKSEIAIRVQKSCEITIFNFSCISATLRCCHRHCFYPQPGVGFLGVHFMIPSGILGLPIFRVSSGAADFNID